LIRRYASQQHDLEQVREDLENGLEDPELADALTLKDFSDLEFRVEYKQGNIYTAISHEHSIRITMDENILEVETAEKNGEEFDTSEYRFLDERVELPERNIGGRETSPIDAALRKYARELYPEKQKPGKEAAWTMGKPPEERGCEE
jgi:hypothetical protein